MYHNCAQTSEAVKIVLRMFFHVLLICFRSERCINWCTDARRYLRPFTLNFPGFRPERHSDSESDSANIEEFSACDSYTNMTWRTQRSALRSLSIALTHWSRVTWWNFGGTRFGRSPMISPRAARRSALLSYAWLLDDLNLQKEKNDDSYPSRECASSWWISTSITKRLFLRIWKYYERSTENNGVTPQWL